MMALNILLRPAIGPVVRPSPCRDLFLGFPRAGIRKTSSGSTRSLSRESRGEGDMPMDEESAAATVADRLVITVYADYL